MLAEKERQSFCLCSVDFMAEKLQAHYLSEWYMKKRETKRWRAASKAAEYVSVCKYSEYTFYTTQYK